MEKLKKLLIDLLFPPAVFAALLIPAAFALLIYAFACENAGMPVTYASYFLSAYALVVACARAPAILKKARAIKRDNQYIHRYSTDAGLRIRISLCGSFAMNSFYTLMQLSLGLIHHSVWFYALAGYYLMLGVMRCLLLGEARKNRLGQDKQSEYRLYRLCGALLAVMNLALGVVVFYIVWCNRGVAHHDIVTIAMAAYTFFTLTMAIVNVIRYRKYDSPVMSAAKVISFAAALVSMLSLETAMLTAFGEESEAAFRRIMTACTGVAVCLAVLAMAVFMIARATREIRKIKGASLYGKE